MALIYFGVWTIWTNIKKYINWKIKEERRGGRKEGRIKSSYLNDIKSVGGEKKKKQKQTTHQEEKFKDIRHSERQRWKR